MECTRGPKDGSLQAQLIVWMSFGPLVGACAVVFVANVLIFVSVLQSECKSRRYSFQGSAGNRRSNMQLRSVAKQNLFYVLVMVNTILWVLLADVAVYVGKSLPTNLIFPLVRTDCPHQADALYCSCSLKDPHAKVRSQLLRYSTICTRFLGRVKDFGIFWFTTRATTGNCENDAKGTSRWDDCGLCGCQLRILSEEFSHAQPNPRDGRFGDERSLVSPNCREPFPFAHCVRSVRVATTRTGS